jgi:hypothetical protein
MIWELDKSNIATWIKLTTFSVIRTDDTVHNNTYKSHKSWNRPPYIQRSGKSKFSFRIPKKKFSILHTRTWENNIYFASTITDGVCNDMTTNINKLDRIQRQAARFITKDHKSRKGCIWKCLKTLNCKTYRLNALDKNLCCSVAGFRYRQRRLLKENPIEVIDNGKEIQELSIYKLCWKISKEQF